MILYFIADYHHHGSERFPLVATSLYTLCIAMMIVNSCNDSTWSKGCIINFHRTVWLIRPFQISPMD